jgi:hypothetical protein
MYASWKCMMHITKSSYAANMVARQARRMHLPASSDLQITIVLHHTILRWCRCSRDINIPSSSVEDRVAEPRLWLFVSTRPYSTRPPPSLLSITQSQTSFIRVLQTIIPSRPHSLPHPSQTTSSSAHQTTLHINNNKSSLLHALKPK